VFVVFVEIQFCLAGNHSSATQFVEIQFVEIQFCLAGNQSVSNGAL